MEFLNGIKDWLTDFLNDVQSVIMALLPDSPFTFLSMPEEIEKILGYINWVIPFYLIGNTLMAWSGAIAIYYAYQTILRWIKSIQ